MLERDLKEELTPLERRFVIELAKDGNRAAAAERAGCQGSKSTFKKLGYQMINRPHVKKAFDELTGKMLEKSLVTKDSLINEIQDTIMEARVAKKFDAAFKGYSQLIDLVVGNEKKKVKVSDDANDGANKPSEAFNQGDEEVDVNDDLMRFLSTMKVSSDTGRS